MADVFISYSREDREWVERLATQLQSAGYSVWWDWDLLVGKRYRETIDNELKTCRATIVVWSQHSIQSDFVRDEAEEAQQRNVLVPVLKESVRPPAGFRQIQTADLSAWSGGADHAEFRRVVLGIANLAGSPTNCEVSVPAPSVAPLQSAEATASAAVLTPTFRAQNAPPVLSKLAARLPPLSPSTWRIIGFGAVGLVAVLLIASQFTSSGRKPIVPPIVTNAATPQPVISADEPDIGQTGPRRAESDGGHTGNDNSDSGNSAGDSGDIGQGGAR